MRFGGSRLFFGGFGGVLIKAVADESVELGVFVGEDSEGQFFLARQAFGGIERVIDALNGGEVGVDGFFIDVIFKVRSRHFWISEKFVFGVFVSVVQKFIDDDIGRRDFLQ